MARFNEKTGLTLRSLSILILNLHVQVFLLSLFLKKDHAEIIFKHNTPFPLLLRTPSCLV